jgi:uncharacterized protein YbjQ (UPF0145 family)
MKNLIIISSIGIAILTGCATGEVTKTTSKNYAATTADSVEILFEKPTRKYEVIGYVKGTGAKLSSQENIFNHMRLEAAKIGADAILMRSEIEEKTDWNNTTQQGSALAIKWQ